MVVSDMAAVFHVNTAGGAAHTDRHPNRAEAGDVALDGPGPDRELDREDLRGHRSAAADPQGLDCRLLLLSS